MTATLKCRPLTAEAFAPFGDVVSSNGAPSFMINGGKCERYHDLAGLDFVGEGGRANISIAISEARNLPYRLDLLERHPLGSQAFIPMSERPFLVVVAPDDGGVPGEPVAFLSDGTQGINYGRNVWHGVLTPLDFPQQFVVVDRTGPGDNLEEHHLDEPYLVVE